jgi:hypothetical protein
VFTIPGLTPNSPPLLLRVNPSGSAGPSLAPNAPTVPSRNALTPGQTDANGIRLTPDGSSYLRLEVPKHEIYVGESVPTEIQIGMRDGFATSINGLPKLNSSDFTLNNLSLQPEKSATVIDGKPFTVYTWRSVLAAIKPGSYSLDFAAPVTVRIRTQPRGDSLLDDMLGDPFMQNVFGSFVTKNITVTSPEAAFTVLPLPADGRPADFNGAVGSFKVSSDVSSATNTAGDPLTLRLHVSGAGSFDRVESGMLTGDPAWRTYQPKAIFSPAEPTGFRGEKVFEQPIIASQPGSQTIPPLSFSYFDPSVRRYETVKSAALHVSVAPSAADSAAAPPPAVAGSAASSAAQPRDGLRPDHAPSMERADSLTPLYLRPMFLGAESALALLLGAGWITVHRRERNARDMQRQLERRRRETLDALLKQMAAAAAAGDTALFFTAARNALQHALAATWHIEPDQVTAAELEARFDGSGDDVKRIFTLADEANYSGVAPQAAHFEGWTRTVQRRVLNEEAV